LPCHRRHGLINKSYGSAAMSRANVHRWYARCREGREDMKDDARSGLPSTARTDENVESIRHLFFNFGFHPICCSISITIIIQSNTTKYHVRPSNSEVTIHSMQRHVSVVCRLSSGLQELTYVNCNATILKDFKTVGSNFCSYYNYQLK
jgi:hypothetical protein